jgi:hypothetical protein
MDVADTTPRVGRILGIPAQELLDCIGLAICAGFGLMFSPTSDGGALGVHLYAGEGKLRQYATTAEELQAILRAVSDRAEAQMTTGPAPIRKLAVRGPQTK